MRKALLVLPRAHVQFAQAALVPQMGRAPRSLSPIQPEKARRWASSAALRMLARVPFACVAQRALASTQGRAVVVGAPREKQKAVEGKVA